MFNILTIDLEDYFQVHAFSNVVRFEDWGNHESRIEHNTCRILEILNGLPQSPVLSPQGLDSAPCSPPKATFFILGWLAERYPHLIRKIKKEGHEIACHGHAHQLIYNQSKDEFREDIKRAKAILEDVSGDEVIGYRAPSYSITNKSQWAFEVLMEEGFKYDSSIFPIHHDFYGFPQAPRFPFRISLNGNNNYEFQILNFELKAAGHSTLDTPHSLLEFPLSTVRFGGVNFPISGGGYFRLFPYFLIEKGLRRINEEEEQPFIFYIHPWEIDPDQPRINSISRKSRFRHYVNLHKTESKFKNLLSDFRFSAISNVLNGIPQHGITPALIK